MSKITQNYIEARRDGIKWLNSQKRDYSTGVNILTRSGYKGFVAARLARQGEKPHTREKLEYEIRQMIKVWYHPDDPRFEDVDLADDAMPGNDGRSETVPEETAAAIVAVAERELAREADEQPAYPPVMAKIIYDFRECYNERSRQHRMLAGLGETNTQAVCTQRKDIVARIAFLSNRMTLLAAIKRQFEQDRELPTEEQLDELYKGRGRDRHQFPIRGRAEESEIQCQEQDYQGKEHAAVLFGKQAQGRQGESPSRLPQTREIREEGGCPGSTGGKDRISFGRTAIG